MLAGSRYFGEPWPSGVCVDGVRVPTPVGEPCVLCEVVIVEGDRGSLGWGNQATHRECGFRSVMGGIEHLTAPPGHALGSCYEGSELSYRESSLRAWDWWMQRATATTPGAPASSARSARGSRRS